MKKALACLIIGLAAVCGARADEMDTYKFDMGVGLGMSGYLGDANQSNMFRRPGVTGNLTFRYLGQNNRLALRAMAAVATLSGNTADWDNKLPGGAQYSFKSTSVDVQVRGEFNFFPYGIGETYKRLKRITPYLAVGVGANVSLCGGQTAFAPTVPMAFGVKFKASRRMNLSAEFCMTKVFGDKVDGAQLTDLYTIESSFIKNNDWVSTITVGVTWEFGPRCVVCHRQ